MRNLSRTIALLCAVCCCGLFLTSCEKDDDDSHSKKKREISYVTETYENGNSTMFLSYTSINYEETVGADFHLSKLYFCVGFWFEDLENDPYSPSPWCSYVLDIYIKDGYNRTLESLKVGEELDIVKIYYYEPLTIYLYPDPRTEAATIESGRIEIVSKDSEGVGLWFDNFKFKPVDSNTSYTLNGTAGRYITPFESLGL